MLLGGGGAATPPLPPLSAGAGPGMGVDSATGAAGVEASYMTSEGELTPAKRACITRALRIVEQLALPAERKKPAHDRGHGSRNRQSHADQNPVLRSNMVCCSYL